jgi:nucleoside-diphosphate-sugar epimerase
MTASTQTKTALIVGVTGTFGVHAAQALIKHGWTVRALARDPAAAAEKLGPRTPIQFVQGDAMDAASVAAAAAGVQLVVHAANPPAYRNWKGTVLPMVESAMAAAKAAGARLVVPASVYNFAPDAGPAIREDAPQAPATRKGAIRVELERRLRAASEDGLKVLVLRAGDFFGPVAPNSALGWITQRKGARLTGVYRAGPASVGHCFAYMPDLGETLARLVEQEDRLGAYEVFHFRGEWLEQSGALAETIRKVLGRPDLPINAFPWLVVRLASPFNETFRELLEMRYLQEKPIGLDNARLVAFLGEEPHTPFETAIRATLADMGCLQEIPREGGASGRMAAWSDSSAIAPMR